MAEKNNPKIKSELTTENILEILLSFIALKFIKEFNGNGPVNRYNGFTAEKKSANYYLVIL